MAPGVSNVEIVSQDESWSHLVKTGPPAYAVLSEANCQKFAVADGLERRRDPVTGHNSLHASKPFRRSDIIAKFSAEEYLSSPNFLSVQVGKASHIILHPAHLQYMNHKCEPNVFFNTETFEVEALMDISVGHELGFFYPSTEWNMETPFTCCCGSKLCVGRVAGAKYLPAQVLPRYRLTKHIAELLEDMATAAGSN